MSTMHDIITIEYNNRKPSRAVIMRTLAAYIEIGGKNFDIRWGENWIELNYHDHQNCWYGSGWIKEIGGDDVAKELNDIRRQAVKEVRTLMQAAQAMGKLQIIHIG